MKSPAVQFALLGVLLFVGSRLLAPGDGAAGEHDYRIVIPQSKVDALADQYEQASGVAATDSVRDDLIDRFAEEEMLVRESQRWGLTSNNEAVDLRLRQIMAFVSEEELSEDELEREVKELGLGADDAVIRNMLAHNMRLLLAREGEREPTDEELEAYFVAQSTRFARPPRLTGWHVFFAKDLRRSGSYEAAARAKATLTSQNIEPEKAVELGDASPSGGRFKGKLPRQLASRFGEAFAETAQTVPVGHWSAPVQTPFGTHVVFVEGRADPVVPPLAEIRGRVVAAYRSTQREARLAAAMAELRRRYEVVVE